MSNHYDILGVNRDATANEIKVAFRKFAKLYHPDVCKEASGKERFQRINASYSVLSNKVERIRYDRIRAESFWDNDDDIFRSRKGNREGGGGGGDGGAWDGGEYADMRKQHSNSNVPKFARFAERLFSPMSLFVALPVAFVIGHYGFQAYITKDEQTQENVEVCDALV
jgi:curved DNA-binding protein CbpA